MDYCNLIKWSSSKNCGGCLNIFHFNITFLADGILSIDGFISVEILLNTGIRDTKIGFSLMYEKKAYLRDRFYF